MISISSIESHMQPTQRIEAIIKRQERQAAENNNGRFFLLDLLVVEVHSYLRALICYFPNWN